MEEENICLINYLIFFLYSLLFQVFSLGIPMDAYISPYPLHAPLVKPTLCMSSFTTLMNHPCVLLLLLLVSKSITVRHQIDILFCYLTWQLDLCFI